jgi:hypothetical protein
LSLLRQRLPQALSLLLLLLEHLLGCLAFALYYLYSSSVAAVFTAALFYLLYLLI